MQDYEKLGVFYLGKKRDVDRGETTAELVLYDAKHLVTHAVVVGMTGSGKTGLCIDLLEEAAIDGIPVIAIDPKGDIGNLLLGFPEMKPGDFEPWVDPQEAERAGVSVAEHARVTAERWSSGLAASGIEAARITRLTARTDLAIYTPGSNAGIPLSVLKSFDVPPPAVLADEELLRERVSTTTTGLLGLVGLGADPMQSREHILLSTLLDGAWRAGRSLDLPTLIHAIQNPPFDKVGVLDLESFYPAKDRFGLVMALNNLVASPSFASWSEGEPLDIGTLLATPEGKPRISVLSIAHLDDAQRMFFVTLLLNQVLGWVRAQGGTSSLRAILYMDEIFGYFPPVANPPSKKPLLTLLKQARAFGLGVVLATQNPVDLDYKGLANTGTWMIGRLQTERDKLRVLEGLEGAATTQGTSFDRARLERILGSLASRSFLMNDVHAGEPFVFESRWAMSYLRGPLTRPEIKRLMDPRKAEIAPPVATPVLAPGATPWGAADPAALVSMPVTAGAAAAAAAATITAVAGASTTGTAPAPSPAPSPDTAAPAPPRTGPAGERMRPALSPDIPQCFLPLRRPIPPGATLVYRPMLLGLARVGMSDAKANIDQQDNLALLAAITDEAVPVHWDQAVAIHVATSELAKAPYGEAEYVTVHPVVSNPKSFASWGKELTTFLYNSRRLVLSKSAATKLVSRPGENEASFRLRLAQVARERRDADVEKLRQKFAPKVATIDDKIRRGHAAIAREHAQAQETQVGTAFSVGSAVLGALTGKRALSVGNVSRAATAARGARRSAKESNDVQVAQEAVQALLRRRQELEDEFRSAVASLDVGAGGQEVLEPLIVKPKKTAIAIVLVTLAFAPYARGSSATAEPLFA